MLCSIYMSAFGFGVVAPEDEDEILPFFGEFADDRVGKFLPTLSLMRTRCACAYCECRVEEQDSLFGPALQIPLLRQGFEGHARICSKFLKNVLKRWRQRHSLAHRKAKSVSLPRAVVRVLSENHDLHFIERRELKSSENVLRCRIDNSVLVLTFHELPQSLEIILPELIFERLFPRRFYLYICLLIFPHISKT